MSIQFETISACISNPYVINVCSSSKPVWPYRHILWQKDPNPIKVVNNFISESWLIILLESLNEVFSHLTVLTALINFLKEDDAIWNWGILIHGLDWLELVRKGLQRWLVKIFQNDHPCIYRILPYHLVFVALPWNTLKKDRCYLTAADERYYWTGHNKEAIQYLLWLTSGKLESRNGLVKSWMKSETNENIYNKQ